MSSSIEVDRMLEQAARFFPLNAVLQYPTPAEARRLSEEALSLDFAAIRQVVLLHAYLRRPITEEEDAALAMLGEAVEALRRLQPGSGR